MGCEICKDEKPQLEDKNSPAGISSNLNGIMFSELTQSADRSSTREKCALPLHNIANRSPPSHVKLAIDPGSPGRNFRREPKPLRLRQSLPITIPKDTDGPAAPEKIVVRKAEDMPVINETPLSAADIQHKACLVASPTPEEGRLDLPRSDTKRSVSSNGSVAFDPGCVVVEKKTGSIYDDYKVVDVVGRGSFGEVKKVLHRASGKAYALKIINKRYCAENGNLLNEISILKQVVSLISQKPHRTTRTLCDCTSLHRTPTSSSL